MDTKGHISSTTPTLLLAVALLAALLPQLLRWLPPKLRLETVMTGRRIHKQSDTGSGKRAIIRLPSLLFMMKSVRNWRSRTAAARLPRIACRHHRCLVRALKMGPILDALMTATILRRLLTTRHCHPWELPHHCLA